MIIVEILFAEKQKHWRSKKAVSFCMYASLTCCFIHSLCRLISSLTEADSICVCSYSLAQDADVITKTNYKTRVKTSDDDLGKTQFMQ